MTETEELKPWVEQAMKDRLFQIFERDRATGESFRWGQYEAREGCPPHSFEILNSDPYWKNLNPKRFDYEIHLPTSGGFLWRPA